MKPLLQIERNAQSHWVGDGFPVRGIFHYQGLGKSASPFLLMDYAGPTDFPPSDEPRGVGAHPHRGFETVTVVYQGEVEHRDSIGNAGHIGPGDVQWMTAASGLIHEEFHGREFAKRGGTLEMVQLWVNLPADKKMSAPGYQGILAEQIPAVPLAGGGQVRVIAGQFQGAKGPARTFTPIELWDIRAPAGAKLTLPVPAGYNTLLFVLHGALQIDGQTAGDAELAMFGQDDENIEVVVRANSTFLLLAGEPIDEPIAARGPFVMNTEFELRQAMLDYHSGKMGPV